MTNQAVAAAKALVKGKLNPLGMLSQAFPFSFKCYDTTYADNAVLIGSEVEGRVVTEYLNGFEEQWMAFSPDLLPRLSHKAGKCCIKFDKMGNGLVALGISKDLESYYKYQVINGKEYLLLRFTLE